MHRIWTMAKFYSTVYPVYTKMIVTSIQLELRACNYNVFRVISDIFQLHYNNVKCRIIRIDSNCLRFYNFNRRHVSIEVLIPTCLIMYKSFICVKIRCYFPWQFVYTSRTSFVCVTIERIKIITSFLLMCFCHVSYEME